MGKVFQIFRVEICVKKVKPVFIVNLHIADCNFVVLISVILDSFKNIPQSSWNYTSLVIRRLSTCNCEGFTRPCLSISKDSPIIAFKSRVNNVLCHCLKYLFLRGISVKDCLKVIIYIQTARVINHISLHVLFKLECYFIIVIC